ncbi:MAG: 50S ribosomal protein L28 [Anaerolineae bacterium]|nr:50S ribosomal protein L28 [Anaerolineae bacterium]NIN94070.1 50S ribosomal protein L28 [Anaerolineae bacterium]NIQ77111.1 50S ribosomal protein L28 [Anaerolineae bacterium]
MARECDICGKGPQFGHSVSHAHNRTKRNWQPNLHRKTISDGKSKRTVRICTRCLRTLEKGPAPGRVSL